MPSSSPLPAEPAKTPAKVVPAPKPIGALARFLGRRTLPAAGYLMRTEVHTYAFSVAANAILSFFPFMVLLMSLIRHVFRSKAMNEVVLQLLRDYLPAGQEFIVRNLNVLVYARNRAAIASFFILLVTSSGVFLPLEVALNRIWGFPRNRSYLRNQMVSLGLALACGCLAVLSIALTAGHQSFLQWALRGQPEGVLRGAAFALMKVFAVGATINIFFLIYWVLPNGKVPVRRVLPAAIIVGLLWEAAKYAYIFALPWLNFQEVYGPFAISVTFIMWAFLSGLLLLGGAYLSADSPNAQLENKLASS